jgi:3-oxoacyl-[acyl-carrier-protein] synthase II
LAKYRNDASEAIHSNLNLDEVDPLCGDLDYITGQVRPLNANIIMSNNFAFGGINTSLIFKNLK